MFLVDGLTKLNIHHVAIYFQITGYNTSAIYLTYYFFTSVLPHERRSHLLELLTLYKDTLNKVTEDFGHPTSLTLDQVFKGFRNKVGYGFWFGFILSIGPGAALFKNVDISKGDIKDRPIVMGEFVNNRSMKILKREWKEASEELVKLMKEYEELRI